MLFRVFSLALLFVCATAARADDVHDAIKRLMAGLDVRESDDPYSRTIEKMYLGYDANGEPQLGVAYRDIESYKTITGLVAVAKKGDGFVIKEALFPDIEKIRNPKERSQVLSILKTFNGVEFDPHAEKSPVDGLTGATRYGLEVSGYLNHLARKTALEMEARPNWPKRKNN